MAGKFRTAQAMFWPVKVKIAKGKNRFDTEEIEIKYKRLSFDELKNLAASLKLPEDATDQERKDVDELYFSEVRDCIVDWKIDDETGKPLEFTPDNLDLVMDNVDYRNAIFREFWEFQNGGAVTKN